MQRRAVLKATEPFKRIAAISRLAADASESNGSVAIDETRTAVLH